MVFIHRALFLPQEENAGDAGGIESSVQAHSGLGSRVRMGLTILESFVQIIIIVGGRSHQPFETWGGHTRGKVGVLAISNPGPPQKDESLVYIGEEGKEC